jgi:hypothetical protein
MVLDVAVPDASSLDPIDHQEFREECTGRIE